MSQRKMERMAAGEGGHEWFRMTWNGISQAMNREGTFVHFIISFLVALSTSLVQKQPGTPAVAREKENDRNGSLDDIVFPFFLYGLIGWSWLLPALPTIPGRQ
jgi:hypothetical protein